MKPSKIKKAEFIDSAFFYLKELFNSHFSYNFKIKFIYHKNTFSKYFEHLKYLILLELLIEMINRSLHF